MATYLRLTVLTPERVLLEVDSVTKVRLRLADQAWLSVYRNHAPVLAETAAGPVQYETDVEAGEVRVGPGILSVSDNTVEVLTSGVYAPEVEAAQGDEDQTFERLARQLLAALAQEPAEPAS